MYTRVYICSRLSKIWRESVAVRARLRQFQRTRRKKISSNSTENLDSEEEEKWKKFECSVIPSRQEMVSSPRPEKRSRKNQVEENTDNTSAPFPPPEKSSPVVVFAHGAGAPSSSDWMIRWKDMLGKALDAVEVVTFDYPYISGGKRKAPPKAEKLVGFHSDVVKKAVAKHPGHPLILAGKSMGSRVSCMVAGEDDIGASAIICLGYPLKGMNGAIRDELLLQLKVPVMFVQGSKDALCPLDKLEAVQKKMKSFNELYVIHGGDHSFKIAKKHLQTSGSTQEEAEDLALQAIGDFVLKAVPGKC